MVLDNFRVQKSSTQQKNRNLMRYGALISLFYNNQTRRLKTSVKREIL